MITNTLQAAEQPNVGQILLCALQMTLAIVLGGAGGLILLAIAIVVLVIGGAGLGLVLLAVALWERAG